MALQAVVVTAANVDAVIDAARAAGADGFRCAGPDGPAHPDRTDLERYVTDAEHVVAAARDGAALLGLLVIRQADGKVKWLVVPRGRAAEVGRFLLVRARNQLGVDPWGSVADPTVRAALLSMAGMVALDAARNQIRFEG